MWAGRQQRATGRGGKRPPETTRWTQHQGRDRPRATYAAPRCPPERRRAPRLHLHVVAARKLGDAFPGRLLPRVEDQAAPPTPPPNTHKPNQTPRRSRPKLERAVHDVGGSGQTDIWHTLASWAAQRRARSRGGAPDSRRHDVGPREEVHEVLLAGDARPGSVAGKSMTKRTNAAQPGRAALTAHAPAATAHQGRWVWKGVVGEGAVGAPDVEGKAAELEEVLRRAHRRDGRRPRERPRRRSAAAVREAALKVPDHVPLAHLRRASRGRQRLGSARRGHPPPAPHEGSRPARGGVGRGRAP